MQQLLPCSCLSDEKQSNHTTSSDMVSQKTNKLSNRLTVLLLLCCSLFVGRTYAQVGSWTPLPTQAPHQNNGVMLLMTDGTVICHTTDGGNLGDGTVFDRLTPDATGSYLNGTWSSIAPMITERFSFSSNILRSGNVYAAGGEYGTDGTQAGYHGETYNPLTNTWTAIAGATAANIISDGDCILLDNSDILQALVDVPFPVHTVMYTPSTQAYTAGPSTLHGQNESMWLKLPDNSILFVNEGMVSSERYIPATNTWIADANVPDSLYDPYGYECGPAWMLPNGEAFFIGGTNHTAIYHPSGSTANGSWRKGPDVPNGYGMPDAPGAMMVNGHLLFACSPQPESQQNEFLTPTKFYEYNYLDSSYTAVADPTDGSQNVCQQYNLLTLPTGEVLLGIDQLGAPSTQYYIYTPGSGPIAAGKPTISTVTALTCTTYMITGTGFNGLTAGSAFGDENQNDNNYPIIRFGLNGNVYYARSYNWNSTGVQRALGGSPKADTAYFTIPNTLPTGTSYLYVVAVGNPSDSVPFVNNTPSFSSPLTNSVCTGTTFAYTATSPVNGATFTWTRAAVPGISNAAITTPQTTNPNEILVNTTDTPIVVTYAYTITGNGCTNDLNVTVTVNPPPTASFTLTPKTSCSVPDTVTFTNTSIAGTSFAWTFGDGGSSSSTNPSYIYQGSGNFNVSLIASSACGIDTAIVTSAVEIGTPNAPTATSPVNINCGANATLTASGTDVLEWFDSTGTLIGTGSSITTNALNSNETFYVKDIAAAPSDSCQPYTDAGASNYAGSFFRSEVFNVLQPCTLVSVVVQANGAGSRTIYLTDSGEVNVLNSVTVNIPAGTSVVTLNFPLTVGNSYELGAGDGTDATNLYRNTNVNGYPYSDPDGYVSIIGNNVPDLVHYYFFYDWHLQGPQCTSPATPVVVDVAGAISIASSVTNVLCNGESNGSVTVTPSGGSNYTYAWSGSSNTTATLSGVPAGTYIVTVSDASCTNTASETISQPTALTATGAATGANGGSNGSASATPAGGTPPYTNSWSNGSTSGSLTGLAPGVYTDTITDVNGCSVIVVDSVKNLTGINNISSGIRFNVYPNPANNQISVAVDNTGVETTLMLEDMLGQTLLTQRVTSATTTLDLSGFSGGVYFVELVQDGNKGVKKFVINR